MIGNFTSDDVDRYATAIAGHPDAVQPVHRAAARAVLSSAAADGRLLPPNGDPDGRLDMAFVLRVLDVMARTDQRDALFWNTTGEYAPITFFVTCPDLFHWASADAEPLTAETLADFERALADARAACGSDTWGPELYCARRRGMRPQGAAYPEDKRLWPLFDACGPERPRGLGNPYLPGERKSTATTREDGHGG